VVLRLPARMVLAGGRATPSAWLLERSPARLRGLVAAWSPLRLARRWRVPRRSRAARVDGGILDM
jgi:hypothetical protein